MANILTQYNAGTFEDVASTWGIDGFTENFLSYERDPSEFYEGAYSGKFVAKAKARAQTVGTFPYIFFVVAPEQVGEQFFISLRLKVAEDFPDDVVFYLNPAPIGTDYNIGELGTTIPVRASEAKADWVELRSYFYADAFPSGELQFALSMLIDSSKFEAQYEFYGEKLQDFYKQLLGFQAASDIPEGATLWVDAAIAEAKPFPAGEDTGSQFTGKKLYYTQNVFYLQLNGTRIFIDEPIGWDDVALKVVFDQKAKAYRFEFSDQDVLLEFDRAAGYEILREQYRTNGSNADVRLLFCEYNPITKDLTVLYEGSINFGPGSAEDNGKTFKANIERQSFTDKLRVFYDTRVDLFRDKSLGGLELDPIQTDELFLHPRLLTFRADYIFNPRIDPAVALTPEPIYPPSARYYSAVPPFTYTRRGGGDTKTANNIDGLQEPAPPDGTLIYAGLELPPGVSKRVFAFRVSVSFSFTVPGSLAETEAGISIYKIPNISGGASGNIPLSTTFHQVTAYRSFGNVGGTKHFSGVASGIIELKADEAIFIKAWVFNDFVDEFSVSGFSFTDTDTSFLEVQEQTVYQPSLIRAPRLHEVLNRQLEIILDTASPLKSDFFGRQDLGYTADGCAANHFAMDGKMIRAFPDRTFNSSLKDLFEPLDGVFNLGMSVERDEDDVETVRVEPMEYFFRDVLLMDLQVISDYVKRPADGYLFNELKFGFEKYPRDNQEDSLDDFHTRMSYVTPLRKVRNKLEVIIKAILSGNYIEYTRQQAFEVNPTNAYETDEDLFLISARQADGSGEALAITFDADAGTITVNKVLALVPGDYLQITGATGDIADGIYPVDAVDINFTFTEMTLSVEDLPGSGSGTGSASVTDVDGNPVSRFQAKRDEDFEYVEGVNFARSVYNLEHHIKRIVLRWAKMFQAGWAFLIGTPGDWSGQGLDFAEGANNTKVITRLRQEANCKYGDGRRVSRADAFFVDVNDMDHPVFTGNEIQFKAPLTWTAFNQIRKAFEGRHPEGRNYGYFQFKNPNGEIERGYVFGLEFNPNTQMCSFTLMEKFNG